MHRLFISFDTSFERRSKAALLFAKHMSPVRRLLFSSHFFEPCPKVTLLFAKHMSPVQRPAPPHPRQLREPFSKACSIYLANYMSPFRRPAPTTFPSPVQRVLLPSMLFPSPVQRATLLSLMLFPSPVQRAVSYFPSPVQRVFLLFRALFKGCSFYSEPCSKALMFRALFKGVSLLFRALFKGYSLTSSKFRSLFKGCSSSALPAMSLLTTQTSLIRLSSLSPTLIDYMSSMSQL